MSRLRILRRVGAFALVAGLLAVAWLVGVALREASKAQFSLANGVRVSVLGTTYGTQHRRPGLVSRLPRVLRELARRLTGRQGSGPDVITTGSPELVVWVSHDATNSAALSGDLRFALADENARFAGEPGALSVHGAGPGTGTVGFTTVPRRAAELRFLAFEFDYTASGKYRRIASIPLANPVAGGHPEWAADPFPVRQTNNQVVCTLGSVRTGIGISSSTTALPDGSVKVAHSRSEDDVQNRAILEVTFEDRVDPSRRWEVTSVVVADATGNVITNSSLSSSSTGSNVHHYTFGPCLWPTETWAMTLTAGRRADAGFVPDELLTFAGVPLPAVDEVGRPEQVLRSGETTVTLQAIHRRAPLSASAGGWSASQLSRVELTVNGLPADHKFSLIQAADDLGRALEVLQYTWGPAEPHQASFAFRSVERDAQTLDLQFAIHRLVPFHFRVRPDLATTNDFIPDRF